MEAIRGTSECSHVQQSMNLAGTTPVIGVQGRGRLGVGWEEFSIFSFLIGYCIGNSIVEFGTLKGE